MKISKSEVLRYLGYGGAAAERRILALIAQLTAELEACVNPKSSFGICDCRIDAPAVTLGDITVNSKNLAEHLKGCRHAALMAATLGAGADSLIRRYSVRDMEKAAIAHAICAAMIEAYCDQAECEILQNSELYPAALTDRFSPGYGDFALSHQKDILRLLGELNRGSHIGLTLTDGYMLIPSKSVTAVIGLTGEKRHAKEKCGSCAGLKERCAFKETK